jgi:heptosyltransferase-2
MHHILVIRFGSLGDLCLLAWSLARLRAAGDGRQHVTLATKVAFADLLTAVPGVDDVAALTGSGPLAVTALAGRLRRQSFDVIVDAHNILRGHLLLALLGRRPNRRLAKDTTARLSLLLTRRGKRRLTRTMRDRFDELFAPLLPPGIYAGTTPTPPLAGFADAGAAAAPRSPVLGVAPGARWNTKRWPEAHFVELIRGFRHLSCAPLRLFLGPDEQKWFPGSELARTLAESGEVELIHGRPLTEVATQLAGCTALVTNDSGLMHLAEATGVPVLALFGPTVREFGYFPSLTASESFEIDLDCRPCSRTGKRPCHRGDLACLERIAPGTLLAALQRNWRWPPASRKDDHA